VSPEPEEQSPAMLRLEAYLESLREEPPHPDSELVPRIVRRARWQRIVRAPLHAAGSLFGAVADGIAVIFGSGAGRHS
jgi:hypothetical protein